MMPEISIIMPVYNGEKFLDEAIGSVLMQTHLNWELIIVDDGSIDNTARILEQYVDSRIIKLHQSNRGEGGARNVALEIARGDFVALLDADDLYLPSALSDYISFFQDHEEIDVIFANGYMIDEQGRKLMMLSELRSQIFTNYILEALVLDPMVVSVPSCMAVRRASVEMRGVRFDETLNYGVDWDFWIQLALYCRFDFLPSPVSLYRVHQTNMTGSGSLRDRKSALANGRLKIMASDWFNDLSDATRKQFFYNLLLELLTEDPKRQKAVLESAQFSEIPGKDRSHLLQLVASEYLVGYKQLDSAHTYLLSSLIFDPGNHKSQLLLKLMEIDARICRVFILVWRAVNQVKRDTFLSRSKMPRPVPESLFPKLP